MNTNNIFYKIILAVLIIISLVGPLIFLFLGTQDKFADLFILSVAGTTIFFFSVFLILIIVSFFYNIFNNNKNNNMVEDIK